MITKRIIPCLDVKDERVVKGVKFQDLQDVDCPEKLAEFYCEQGADELVFYDITATSDGRPLSFDFVEKVAENVNIPFCVGGGVNSIDDFSKILKKGADKVSINSAAVRNPELIEEAAKKFGNQCVVLSVDAKKNEKDVYEVYISGGRINTGLEVVEWVKKAVELGAGEIVVNSIDEDGMKKGYDIELLKLVCDNVNVPVIASGGAGKKEDFLEVVQKTEVDGMLAASIFHFKEVEIPDLKRYLHENGVLTRI